MPAFAAEPIATPAVTRTWSRGREAMEVLVFVLVGAVLPVGILTAVALLGADPVRERVGRRQ
jgi:uncharacterized membrane protein